MAAKARLEGTMGWNDTEFVNGVARTEQRAKTVAGRIENLFQFRGERRVAKGTGLFGAQILSAQSGVDVLEASVLGLANVFKLGFGTTVGIIAGAAIFNKLKGSIDETRKAYEAAEKELNKPITIQAGLDVEGVGEQLDSLKKKREELFSHADTFSHTLVKLFTAGDRGPDRDIKAIQDLIDKEEQLGKLRGQAALRNVGAEELTANQGEHAGELAKIRAKFANERAKVQLEDLGAGRADRLEAVNRAEALAVRLSDEKAAKKQEELNLENRLLDIKESGLTKDEQSLSTQRAKVQSLQTQLSNTTNPDERSQISARLRGSQDELMRSEYAHRNDAGSALYTPERGAEQAFQGWKADRAARNVNGAGADSFDSLMPSGYSPGREAASGARFSGSAGIPEIYGEGLGRTRFTTDAKTNLRDWGVRGNDLTGFGAGSFMDVRQMALGKFQSQFKDKAADGGGPQGGLKELAGAIEKAFDSIMGKYWK